MNSIRLSYILTSIAGLSTILGYFIIYLKIKKELIITFALSFAGSVMLTISIIDLIPSAFSYLNNYYIIFKILIFVFFFILGIIISNYISCLIDNKTNSLKKTGLILMIAIILHNIPEGIITFFISSTNIKLGIKFAIAIGMHNIPEGISIAIPFFYGTNNKYQTFLIVLIAGLSEILGALICHFFLKNILTYIFIGICFSIVSGIMINISLTELLKKALEYQNKRIIFLGIILGIFVMLISHLL